MTEDSEEITLALGLLGGVIAILLYINSYFNNNVIPPYADFQMIAFNLIFILLLEIPLILLFFLFKCILIYTEPDCWKDKIKIFTQALFKLSFIDFLIWFIAITITFIFGYILIIFNIKISDHPGILYIYNILLLTLLIIVGLVLFDCNIFKSILHININSLGDFWERNKKLFLIFIGLIVVVFFGLLVYSIINMLSLYMLMGSYSIEEFLQSNNENITIGIKETGIISNTNFINLYKMDSDYNQSIDVIKISYNQINSSEKGFMNGTNNEQFGIWYVNINTSKLQPGNYLLHAEVTIFKNPTLGTVKKQADKLFYIPPKNTNCSFST